MRGSGITLADGAVTGPHNHRGQLGVYGVVDQMVWRGAQSSLNLFVRGGVSPSDRNLVSYYVDGGAGLKGLLPGRPEDTLTFGMAYAKISRDVVALDQDNLVMNGPPYAVRDAETLFELSYMAPIRRPNGGQNPDDATQALGHAFIAGIRSTIKF